MNTLFSPMVIGRWSFPNRIVMPPMVRYTLNSRDGRVTDRSIEHYRDAASSTGLVVVEATAVAENAKLHTNMLGLWCDEQIDGMRRLAEAIHETGAAAMIQLCYAGLCSRDPSSIALGPSPEYFDTTRLSRAATIEEIQEIEALHAAAALRAMKAGFDGIELHATHGYFNCRFLDAVSNQRTDRYAGGSAQGRTRIVTEMLAAIRKEVGDQMLLSVRIGCNMPDFSTAQENLLEIVKAPLDLIHFSRGTVMPAADPSIPPDFPCNTVVYHSAKLARLSPVPVILSNEIRTPGQAQYLIQNGFCDFAAVGRGILADPHWARKASSGDEGTVDRCYGCADCQWRIDPDRCPAALRRSVLRG